jgi:electron transfer flavoprotein beta subunit
MKIIVLVKQTFDTEARIELSDEGCILEQNIKRIINPYDELAIEEAVKIKETTGADITVISLGPDMAEDALRQALAMGADRAILLNDSPFLVQDGCSRAKVLAETIAQREYDLILAGWVSIDDGSAQTAVRIAEILDIPQVTVVTNLHIAEDKALVRRETDDGMEIIEVSLPALITVQKGINEPRYPSFKGIMQAKKKELKKITLAELNTANPKVNSPEAKVSVEKIELPPKRASCKKIEAEHAEACRRLVELLQNEAKVI